MMKYSPIALFVYNRLDHTKQTVNALLGNTLSSESDLYVFCDGSKGEGWDNTVQQVRDYIHTIKGFNSVNIVESPKNKGLANSIIEGVNAVLDKHGTVIVLEDDLVTSPYFLQYMNDGLELYRDETSVASIHGYSYPLNNPQELPDTFFIRGAFCWGWATWKRAWDFFEVDGSVLYKRIESNEELRYLFNFNDTEDYMLMLEHQIKGVNNSWAIRWYASAFLENMYMLCPSRTFVKNIGMDSTGTHCGKTNKFTSGFIEHYSGLTKQVVKDSEEGRKKMESFFKPRKKTLIEKIFAKFS